MESLNIDQINEIARNIPMYKVFSSNVSGIGYDNKNKLMKVIFKGNHSYLYFNVEQDTYDNIMNSESKGKTLNESVVRQKDKYKYIKLN